jgi:hypothetical protein
MGTKGREIFQEKKRDDAVGERVINWLYRPEGSLMP